jgi:hypothetical protein
LDESNTSSLFCGTFNDAFNIEAIYSQAFKNKLKMAAVYFSETSVNFYRTTRRHIPEVNSLHNHRCDLANHIAVTKKPKLEEFRQEMSEVSFTNPTSMVGLQLLIMNQQASRRTKWPRYQGKWKPG